MTYLAAARTRLALPLTLVVVILGGLSWYFAEYYAFFLTGRVPPLRQFPMRIVPGIYLLGGLSPSVVYVVETSEGLVLVDSGLQEDAGPLKSQMAELGLDWKRVRAIFLTHTHADHCGGAESLRAATNAKVYAGEGDASTLRAGKPREAFFSVFDMPNDTPHPTTVDVALKGGEIYTFGDVSIRCIGTPGHTPGSTCYLLERKNLRALFAGDVIMMLVGDENPSNEMRKPLGNYPAYLPPHYRGNAKDTLASLRLLRTLPVPDLVLPGHPTSDASPQSPRLTQARWESLLDGGIHDMEVLLSRYEKDGADFLDGIPKELLPDLYYLGDFGRVAVYGFFASSQFFLVNAPGGQGLVEFVSTRLRQLGREPAAPTAVLLTSCDSQQTAGLKGLVEKWHSQVVASPAGLERLREICPAGTAVLSSQELPRKGWPAILTIPLAGRGLVPIAYQMKWAGKTVLFSGRIPLKMNKESAEALAEDLVTGTGDVHAFFASLLKLQELKQQLWLPAEPIEGQNANLYDKDWERTIEHNLHVARVVYARSQRK